jgi:fibronectin-binding autotransporter adhesin
MSSMLLQCGRCFLASAFLLVAATLGGAPVKPKDNNGQASIKETFVGDIAPTETDVVVIETGKRVKVDADSRWSAIELTGGIIDGTNSVTLLDSSSLWTGGEILETTLNANGMAIGAGSAKKIGSGAKLNLTGTTLWSADDILSGGAAEIANSGVFNVTFDGAIADDDSGTKASFKNSGTFEKSGGSGGHTEIAALFENTGAVFATVGTLKLTGGGSSSNTVTVSDGARLQIAAGTFAFIGGELKRADATGTGVIEISNATATFSNTTGDAHLSVIGAGIARFDGDYTGSGKFTLAAGTVEGSGLATIGSLEWTGGNLNGKVKTTGASTISNAGKTLSGGELTLGGATTWTGGTITAGNNGRIRNEATFSVDGDGIIENADSSTFENAGTFEKIGGAATTELETAFENASAGIVKVNSGTLKLSGGARSAGAITVNAGSAIEIAGGLRLEAGSELKGNGVARFLGGLLEASGLIEITRFDFDGGTLAGSNRFNGIVNWKGGNWSSAGGTIETTTIDAGAVLNLRNGNGSDFTGRNIHNLGTVNWHAGDLHGGRGGVFTNEAAFNDLHSGNQFITLTNPTFSFANTGDYRKTGSGTTTLEVAFINHGTLIVDAGTIVFAASFMNHGTAKFAHDLEFGPSAVLGGSGTLTAPSVTAGGIVAPGSSAGTLNIVGDLALLSTSRLLIELGGGLPGTGYDVLEVTGNAALAGALEVRFANGFEELISSNDTFTILTAAGVSGVSGAFANAPIEGIIRLATADGWGSFRVNYGLNSVVLNDFQAIPEPSTYALMGVGAVLVLATLRRRRR